MGTDGRSILFLRETDGVVQVFTKAAPDAPSAQVTKAAQSCSAAVWSSDGSQIYYTSGGLLWVVGANGGEPQQLDQPVRALAMSRDGASMAYFKGVVGNYTLWLRRISGGPRASVPHAARLPTPCGSRSRLSFLLTARNWLRLGELRVGRAQLVDPSVA